MIKHIWSVLCQKSVIDNESNNISLFEILEQLSINVPSGKSGSEINIPINFEIISFWTKDSNDKEVSSEIEIEYRSPNNNLIKKFTQSFNIPSHFKRMRTRLRIQGIGVMGEGDYSFVVKQKTINSKNFDTVVTLPLEVKVVHDPKENIRRIVN